MKKSIWIEGLEWCVLGLIFAFLLGLMMMRGEITSSVGDGSTAPVSGLVE